MTRAAALASILAAALLSGACGGSEVEGASRTVDREQVEGLLRQRQTERNPRLRVQSASCPDGVAARAGETFECIVVIEGVQAPFTVTIAEVLGDQVRYDLRSRLAIVDVVGVADFIRSRLEESWRATARVDCGNVKVRLVEVGGTVDCTVTNGTQTRSIQAVVEDRDGTFTLRERSP